MPFWESGCYPSGVGQGQGLTKRLEIERTCRVHAIGIRSFKTRSSITTWLYYCYGGKREKNLLEARVLNSAVKHGTV